MKILVLDEEFPFPLNSGKRIRSFQIWSRIAKHCEVTYLAYGTAQSESAKRLREAGINAVPVDHKLSAHHGPGFYFHLFSNLLSRHPLTIDRHFSNAYLSAYSATLSAYRPDLVVCEWTPYAQYAQAIPARRMAVVAHNIEATVWRRYAEQSSPGPTRWYLNLQSRRMERFEREAARGANGVITVSEIEAAIVRQWSPGASVITVENGVDIPYFTRVPSAEGSGRLVFSGAMDWRPNQHAVNYFVRHILPIIRECCSGVSFTIVGRNPSKGVVRLAAIDGVEVTGTVDDIRPYLAAATVCVVPLFIGGGSRLKILEALAMSLPVVSTSVGAEGLRIEDGTHFLKADDAATFAHQVCRLLTDSNLRSRMGREGRVLVEQSYNWDGLADRQLQFLSSLCMPT